MLFVLLWHVSSRPRPSRMMSSARWSQKRLGTSDFEESWFARTTIFVRGTSIMPKKTVVVWIYNTIIQSYYLYFYFIIIISLILFFGLLGLWNHPIDTKRILNPQNRWNFSCLRKPMPKAWRRTNRMWGLRIVTASHITQAIHSGNWSHWFDYSFSSKKLK